MTEPGGSGPPTAPGGAPIRLLLVDDHEVVRSGLRGFLELQQDMVVVAEAGTAEEGLARLRQSPADVVVLDMVLPGMSGVEAIARIRADHPGTKVLALTSFAGQDFVLAAVRAGVSGYLLKDVRPRELADAIRAVHLGQSPMHPQAAAAVLASVQAAHPLTPRETEVLRLIGRGRSNREIARELGLAEKTVKAHVSGVLGKLGVADRTQAALHAVRHGLLDD